MSDNTKCQRCDGCGKIDNGNGEPWSRWENLPVKSAAAVIMGVVKPIPCSDCGGTGEVPQKNDCAKSCPHVQRLQTQILSIRKQHAEEIRQLEHDAREDCRDAAAEAMWQERERHE